MNAKCCGGVFLLLLLTPLAAADEKAAVDLRQGVPAEAHLVVYGKHNAERDYQREYLREVWQTAKDEQIVERLVDIVASRVPAGELEKARSVWDQLSSTLEPIRPQAIFDARSLAYAQVMQPPFNHHLLLVEMTSADADGIERGIGQLFDQLEEWSEGKVSKLVKRQGGVQYVGLGLPPEAPFRPTLARIGNTVILSDTEELARQSAAMLREGSGVSKFDDPRLRQALAELPEAEDALIFFDGRLLFDRIHGVVDFIRQQNLGGGEDAARWIGLMDLFIDELAIFDHEVTVEYTEGRQNRVAVLGKLAPDVDDKLLYQAACQGQPFENWQRWVPADAEAYSLNTGINLHAVYELVMKLVRENIPEAHAALDTFEAKQQEIGFHLDRDLLQAFTGETVSVTVPIEAADGSTSLRGVTALRCGNPDRVLELIDRGVERLTELPPVQAQQLKLVDCAELEGFQELEALILGMFDARPVFGFDDGWMIVSSSPEAVAKVLAARRGAAESIDQGESFQRFDLQIEGPVQAVSYTHLGAAVNEAAKTIEQIGAIAPMFIGMMAAQADPEDLKSAQEILGLLPSVAKVVRKFDFMEDQLSVTRAGPTKETYRRDAVVLIRAPEAE